MNKIRELLEEFFDETFERGGDIVLQRQFENGRENYKRYRTRCLEEAQKKLDTIFEEVIGKDEIHWNSGEVVFDYAMTPEAEENHNKRVDVRNGLRVSQRKRYEEMKRE